MAKKTCNKRWHFIWKKNEKLPNYECLHLFAVLLAVYSWLSNDISILSMPEELFQFQRRHLHSHPLLKKHKVATHRQGPHAKTQLHPARGFKTDFANFNLMSKATGTLFLQSYLICQLILYKLPQICVRLLRAYLLLGVIRCWLKTICLLLCFIDESRKI